MRIAFFDLDKTLLSVNSGSLWVKSEYRSGRLPARMLLRASGWLTLYHLGFHGRLESLLREAVRTLDGQSEAELRDRTRQFYEDEVRGRFRPGALEALEKHRALGELRVLLTTSSNYLSMHVAADLELDDIICNSFLVDEQGLFTGLPKEPLCAGSGKLTLAAEYAAERAVRLSDCSFYTDSAADLPAMEAMGEPVAVNPDPRLRRRAAKEGWRIVDWGTDD